MQAELKALLEQSINKLQSMGQLPSLECDVRLTPTKDSAHGHFASNVALSLAKKVGQAPLELAQAIIENIEPHHHVERVEIAGPGFINFYLINEAQHKIIATLLQTPESVGRSQLGHGKKVNVEYVSCNPTGPLHVGHGRTAAYGACVANLLAAVGYSVHREYYVNDAGRQMHILAASTYCRYLTLCGESIPLPSNAYQGDYIIDIAKTLIESHGHDLVIAASSLLEKITVADTLETQDAYIDQLIEQIQNQLSIENFQAVLDRALQVILADIRTDLQEFGVEFDEWFSERGLVKAGAIDKALTALEENGHLYHQDGATWFRASEFGDEKDRVLVRANGQYTYFCTDIAYHLNKLDRGFHILDIFGADHHGYLARIHGVLPALGRNRDHMQVKLVQFVTLYRGKEKVGMSTRSGSFITLRELREEVGNDAARFFYVMRKADQHMDFDLELAKSQKNENPVYYIQYAHARICSVFAQLKDQQMHYDEQQGLAALEKLTNSHELALVKCLDLYQQTVEKAAMNYDPHLIVQYCRDLADNFHGYYNAHKFIVDDMALCNARLALVSAVKIVLANALNLLGVTPVEKM